MTKRKVENSIPSTKPPTDVLLLCGGGLELWSRISMQSPSQHKPFFSHWGCHISTSEASHAVWAGPSPTWKHESTMPSEVRWPHLLYFGFGCYINKREKVFCYLLSTTARFSEIRYRMLVLNYLSTLWRWPLSSEAYNTDKFMFDLYWTGSEFCSAF